MTRKCSYFLRTGSTSEVHGPVEGCSLRAAGRRPGLPRFNGDTYESGSQQATLHRGRSFQLCGSAEQRAAGPHTQQIIRGPALGRATGQPRSVGRGQGRGPRGSILSGPLSARLNMWTRVQMTVEETNSGSFSHAA